MVMILVVVVVFFVTLWLIHRFSIARCRCKACLVGKTALITGANSGIGYQVALDLASRGCRIIIADVVESTESRDKIIQQTNNPNVIYKRLDLQSLKSVRKFAQDIISTEKQLDILICNAGIGSVNLVYTEDSLQKTMQVNYFSHFLLTHLLSDLMKKSAPARIIFTSSLAAYMARFKLDDLNPGKTFCQQTILTGGIYSNSKLCLVIATVGLAARLKDKGITVNCFHPGGTRTNIFYKSSIEDASFLPALLGLLTLPFGRSPEEGAQTAIHLACCNKLSNVTGSFFMECREMCYPRILHNKKLCREVWDKSEEYVQLSPSEKL